MSLRAMEENDRMDSCIQLDIHGGVHEQSTAKNKMCACGDKSEII